LGVSGREKILFLCSSTKLDPSKAQLWPKPPYKVSYYSEAYTGKIGVKLNIYIM
jgi:hypothetical protein